MVRDPIEHARSAIIDAARVLMLDADAACDARGEYTVNARTGTAWVRLREALAALDLARGYTVDASPGTVARIRARFGIREK